MEGFQHFGVMLDCSRNAVMKTEEVKKFASVLAGMGYDTLMLYTEDTYEVEGEPYFGYMRGGYSKEEIREMDAYVKTLGMELVPCIQTLAHFTNLCKLPQYADCFDLCDILLIDEEKTYRLLDAVFASLAQSFSSRTVNIGMDEAHLVGLGKYLDKHGFVNRTELLIKHLNKVCGIAKKYGFRPVMWSDMFFRLANKGEYYSENVVFPDSVKQLVPNDVALIYWDYYHQKQECYDRMLSAHRRLGREIWFAGGAWSWTGFAPMNGYSLATMAPAMNSVLKNGVKNVFITMWGDDGKECSFYALLPALFAISKIACGETDENRIKEEFFRLFKIGFDDFASLDLPNLRRADQPRSTNENLCKCLFYSDPFTGYFDASLSFSVDYAGYAKKLREVAVCGVYPRLFELEAKLCDFLELKYDLGKRTRKAYAEKDTAALKELARNTYPQTAERLKRFYEAFRENWLCENKAFGLEVHEARMGGLMLRLQSCGERLSAYAEGKTDRIDELEAPLLPMTGDDFLNCNLYERLVSFSKI